MTGFVGGIIAGFVYDWRLTLVMLGATPFMMASIAFLDWVSGTEHTAWFINTAGVQQN